MGLSQIDIPAMRTLVSDLSAAQELAWTEHRTMSQLLTAAHRSTITVSRISTAAAWIEEEIPMLRRRLALAEALERSTPGIQGVVTIDESALSTLTPTQARALAARLARRINDGDRDQDLLDQLLAHATDPYFAAALHRHVGVEELASFLTASPGQGSGALQTELVGALRTALVTSASQTEPALSLPDGYADSVQQFLLTGPWDQVVALDSFLGDTRGLPATFTTTVRPGRRMVAGVQSLQDEGILTADPSVLLREWVLATQATGVRGQALIRRARQEGVQDDTFALLEGLTMLRDPDGRAFFALTEVNIDDARRIAELTQLLAGGEPSQDAARRDANNFSFEDTFWLGRGDVKQVLETGGAITATPEGIFMAVPGPGGPLGLPNQIDVWAMRGGTMYGEVFVINGSHDQPGEMLRTVVEDGSLSGPGGHPLSHLLRHERVHAEQWARLGWRGFVDAYLRKNDPNDPCNHPLEIEAGLEDGNYSCP